MLGITQLLQQAQQAQTSGLLQHAYDLYTSAAEQVNHALPQQTDGTRQQLLQQFRFAIEQAEALKPQLTGQAATAQYDALKAQVQTLAHQAVTADAAGATDAALAAYTSLLEVLLRCYTLEGAPGRRAAIMDKVKSYMARAEALKARARQQQEQPQPQQQQQQPHPYGMWPTPGSSSAATATGAAAAGAALHQQGAQYHQQQHHQVYQQQQQQQQQQQVAGSPPVWPALAALRGTGPLPRCSSDPGLPAAQAAAAAAAAAGPSGFSLPQAGATGAGGAAGSPLGGTLQQLRVCSAPSSPLVGAGAAPPPWPAVATTTTAAEGSYAPAAAAASSTGTYGSPAQLQLEPGSQQVVASSSSGGGSEGGQAMDWATPTGTQPGSPAAAATAGGAAAAAGAGGGGSAQGSSGGAYPDLSLLQLSLGEREPPPPSGSEMEVSPVTPTQHQHQQEEEQPPQMNMQQHMQVQQGLPANGPTAAAAAAAGGHIDGAAVEPAVGQSQSAGPHAGGVPPSSASTGGDVVMEEGVGARNSTGHGQVVDGTQGAQGAAHGSPSNKRPRGSDEDRLEAALAAHQVQQQHLQEMRLRENLRPLRLVLGGRPDSISVSIQLAP